jgi:RNA polymerase sigma factor (sigma-70 family)
LVPGRRGTLQTIYAHYLSILKLIEKIKILKERNFIMSLPENNRTNITNMFNRIHYHIGITVKQHHLRQEEIEDLVADIVLAVLQQTHDFDFRLAAWSTFLNTIIEREIKRFRSRKRWRKFQRVASIHDLTEDEHPLTNFYPTYELNDQERSVLFGEIRNVIATLPEELQKICQLLWVDSKNEIAERLEIQPGTLSKKIDQIAFLLSESKIIQEFLENF